MENINDDDIVCIIPPSSPSPQQPGFTTCHLSRTEPVSVSFTHGLPSPQPHLFPYFVQPPDKLPSYLRLAPEDIHVILSTKSGSGLVMQIWDRVVKPVLQLIGLNEEAYRILKTEKHDSVRVFAQNVLRVRAAEGRMQAVLVLSGDGGVVDLLNGVMSDERSSNFLCPTLILFPLGTANALFQSIHRPTLPVTNTVSDPSTVHELVLALRTLLFGYPKPLPTFRAQFSPGSRLLADEARSATSILNNTLYGAIVASYGLHSTLVADSDTTEWRKQGPARFSLVAQQLLNPPGGGLPHAYRARVKIQKPSGSDYLQTNKHGYILFTFVSNLEKTFTISPASTPLDGQLRLVHFGDETAQEVHRILTGAYQDGAHVKDPKVDYEVIQGAEIEFWEGQDVSIDGQVGLSVGLEEEEQGMEGRWRRVCIDGHIVRVEKGGWMKVETLPRDDWPLSVIVGSEVQVNKD